MKLQFDASGMSFMDGLREAAIFGLEHGIRVKEAAIHALPFDLNGFDYFVPGGYVTVNAIPSLADKGCAFIGDGNGLTGRFVEVKGLAEPDFPELKWARLR